jgi:TolB protein
MNIDYKIFSFFLIVLILGLGLNACKDNDNPVSGNPPCIDCPWDFRLTDFEPAWSPDGRTIAYIHGDTVNGQTGIWLTDTSGSNNHILYASVGAYSPSWSPDGQWIAFSDGGVIYKLKLSADSLTQLTTDGSNFFPAWSPDGQWIAYDSNLNDPKGANVIWKMRSDGSNKFDISQHGIGEWRMPDWSLDGINIVHQRYVGVGAPEIEVMDTSGGNSVRLTYDDRFDSYPRYSPNGTKIAFTSQPYGGKPQIWIMNSNGTNPQQLTFGQGYSCDWSPDGEWIVYTDSRNVSGRLWLIRRDRTGNHQLTF